MNKNLAIRGGYTTIFDAPPDPPSSPQPSMLKDKVV